MKNGKHTVAASQILVTQNYEMFKINPHNREIKDAKVKRIIDSIQIIDMSAENPIKANERMEITDGQHRFMAWKILGLPVYYMRTHIKADQTDLAIVQLNANQFGWTSVEYIGFWAKKNNPVYMEILKCNQMYNIPLSIAVLLVTNEIRVGQHDLKEGKLTRGKIDYVLIIKALNDFAEIFKYAKTTLFIKAFLWLYKSKYYNHKLHFEKFVLHRYKLKRCADREQYIQMFEDILNWHNRAKVKIVQEFEEDTEIEKLIAKEKMNQIELLKQAGLTKATQRTFVQRVIKEVETGAVSALNLKLFCKALERTLELLQKGDKEIAGIDQRARDEAEQIKTQDFKGCKVELIEAGTKYDYANCGDPEWQKLAEIADKAKKNLSDREMFLKALKEKMLIVDEPTGEVVTVYPPLKTSTSTVKVTFK